MEMGLVWRAPPERALARVRRVRGAELLESALQARRGLLILGPHLGNWELLNLWLASRGPLTALHEPLRDPALDAWIRRARERSGARLVPTDASGVRALLRTLRAGGMAGILPDQVPPRGAGRHAPFLGRPALTMTLVQRLLRSTGADALMAMALRVPDGFELHFRRPASGLADADPQRAAQALNASVEDCIALAPEQYQWSYKRFKHPPPGHSDPYH
jgi:KDO2-lipid IV(A) lauroyltransferase